MIKYYLFKDTYSDILKNFKVGVYIVIEDMDSSVF